MTKIHLYGAGCPTRPESPDRIYCITDRTEERSKGCNFTESQAEKICNELNEIEPGKWKIIRTHDCDSCKFKKDERVDKDNRPFWICMVDGPGEDDFMSCGEIKMCNFGICPRWKPKE